MLNIIPRSALLNSISSDPFNNLSELLRTMQSLPTEKDTPSIIKVDISENDAAYTVRAEIPGMRKEDVKVQVEGNRISINAETRQEIENKQGERVICREIYQGSSYRSLNLGSEVDASKAEAKFENGRLELILPKKSEKTSQQIEIK